jgi:hypothetical protein
LIDTWWAHAVVSTFVINCFLRVENICIHFQFQEGEGVDELNKNGGLRRRSFADKKMLVPEIRFKKSTKCQRA